jgi:hypothetical protein
MHHFTLNLNARLQPFDRHDIEDVLIEALEKQNLGTVSGGGTGQKPNGEIAYCDIELDLNDNSQETIDKIVEIAETIGLPKGSALHGESDFKREVGTLEGLALYLNGTELPDEVYAECDINHAVKEIEELLGESGELYSHWQGPQDTGLYFYGVSFDEMKAKMSGFLSEYPLCQKCRVEQIA